MNDKGELKEIKGQLVYNHNFTNSCKHNTYLNKTIFFNVSESRIIVYNISKRSYTFTVDNIKQRIYIFDSSTMTIRNINIDNDSIQPISIDKAPILFKCKQHCYVRAMALDKSRNTLYFTEWSNSSIMSIRIPQIQNGIHSTSYRSGTINPNFQSGNEYNSDIIASQVIKEVNFPKGLVIDEKYGYLLYSYSGKLLKNIIERSSLDGSRRRIQFQSIRHAPGEIFLIPKSSKTTANLVIVNQMSGEVGLLEKEFRKTSYSYKVLLQTDHHSAYFSVTFVDDLIFWILDTHLYSCKISECDSTITHLSIFNEQIISLKSFN